MLELFLVTVVDDRDLLTARAILGGLCVTDGFHASHRVCYYTGPQQPRGLPQVPPENKTPQNEAQWKELHQNLARQSFILQLRYNVTSELEGASPPTASETLDAKAGSLRWTDVAAANSDLITNRQKIEISSQTSLPTLMERNLHTFKTEGVEESYTFYQDDLTYSLVRYYTLPPSTSSLPGPRQTLPALTEMTKQDPAGKWLFFVTTEIGQRNRPDLVTKAQQDLLSARDQLKGIFNFKTIDRRVQDTRVVLPHQQGGSNGVMGGPPGQNAQTIGGQGPRR